jgi:hypothetical protein
MRTSNQRAEAADLKPEVVAGFGGARIIQQPDGRLEIQGETEEERAEAHQWMKLFLTQGPLTVRRVG